MITVRCLGHIRTSVGTDVVRFEDEELGLVEIVKRLRLMSKDPRPGFDEYNVIAMVEEGEAYVPASGGQVVRSGQSLVLIPFSHGG